MDDQKQQVVERKSATYLVEPMLVDEARRHADTMAAASPPRAECWS